MTNRYFSVFLSLVISFYALFTLSAGAEEIETPESPTLQRLLAVSSIDDAINALEKQLLLEHVKERITDPENALTSAEQELFMQGIKASAIRRQVIDSLAQELSPQEIDYLLQYYGKDLLVKMNRAKKAALHNTQNQNITAFLEEALVNPPSRERIRLINELVDASLIVEQKIFVTTAIVKEKTRAHG